MNYLVIGLESSCTRVVSRLLALNLNIINNEEDWDAVSEISDSSNRVVHRSLPHGYRTEDNFMSLEEAELFDKIVICTRDWNCSLISKINIHQPNIEMAISEHTYGNNRLKDIYKLNINKSVIFSYESAFLLQEAYTQKILNDIGINNSIHILFTNINEKYIIDTNGGKND